MQILLVEITSVIRKPNSRQISLWKRFFLRDRIVCLHRINKRIQVVHRVEIADQVVLLADLNALWLAVPAMIKRRLRPRFNLGPGATALGLALKSLYR